VSETTLGRALEFMGEPQDVEVHRGGHWVLGLMVGWRQEEGSSCRIMVRITEGGVERTAWADLHDVRLAEHRSYPPTESLPFVPRLPQATTDQMTRSATSGGWREPHGWGDFGEPVTDRAPRADAAIPRTWPDTGRHRAASGIRPVGVDSDFRAPSSGPGRAAGTPRGHDAGAAAQASWWPSS
jgi:hypothetical protein